MKYFLLSTQRSGSDLLRHSLLSIFGEHSDGPDEWIMHPVTRKNLSLPEDLNKAKELVLSRPQLLIDRMSPNSHRKVMYNHLAHPSQLPKDVPIIHLIRKDSWAQAKSLWIMKQKKLPPHVIKDTNQKNYNQPIEVSLDYEHVKHLAKKMRNEKEVWYLYLLKRTNTLTLYYEDDLSDITSFLYETVPRIEAFLGKKRVVDAYNFPFKKTSSLYTIENLKQSVEQYFSKIYYFNPNSFGSKKRFYRHRLKMLLIKLLK